MINFISGEFPHQAVLSYSSLNSNSYHCGGSLIANNFVLTAGKNTFDIRMPKLYHLMHFSAFL